MVFYCLRQVPYLNHTRGIDFEGIIKYFWQQSISKIFRSLNPYCWDTFIHEATDHWGFVCVYSQLRVFASRKSQWCQWRGLAYHGLLPSSGSDILPAPGSGYSNLETTSKQKDTILQTNSWTKWVSIHIFLLFFFLQVQSVRRDRQIGFILKGGILNLRFLLIILQIGTFL